MAVNESDFENLRQSMGLGAISAYALALREIYESFTGAGFSPEEAFTLLRDSISRIGGQ